MRVLRGLCWVLLTIAVFAVAVYLVGRYELADRLTGLFLAVQPWLPVLIGFDQFLVLLTVAGLLVALIILAASAATVFTLTVSRQRKFDEILLARRETDYVREQQRRESEQLLSVAQALAKQLDKRVLVQTMIEAASRMTSVAQASSVVSLWMWHFETDTIRFERGFYCDETLFTQAEFQPTDPTFSRVLSTQQPWLASLAEGGAGIVRKEKEPQLGATTSVMVVPLSVEATVMGILVIFCHPDVLKSYQEQRAFYNLLWGELTLSLATAVQGEVAILDRLTGVHNREYMMKRLIQELERANRYGLSLSLLMIDIDNFKLVNDMLGHPQGDAVLKIIAKLIKKAVRAIDLVGRYGGEEFFVMLPETGGGDDPLNTAGAPMVAERIRKTVDDEFRGLQKPLNLTVSVGVVCRRFPEDRAMDHRELIRLVDVELYRAKTAGKNRVCVFRPEGATSAP